MAETPRWLDEGFPGLLRRLQDLPADRRSIVAVAGPPASGKSTLAEALGVALNCRKKDQCCILPMDGYHYDDGLLRQMGILRRKGCPQSFDAAGLRHMLVRIRRNSEPQIAIPVFDRDLEISRAGARLIPRDAAIIIVEGNYLLVSVEPWNSLKGFFDLTIMLKVPRDELSRRIRQRWEGYGLSETEVRWKLHGNDLPNADYVLANSPGADLIYSSPAKNPPV